MRRRRLWVGSLLVITIVLAGCAGREGRGGASGGAAGTSPAAASTTSASSTTSAAGTGPEGCHGQPGKEIPAVEIPAVHQDPVTIPEATIDGRRIPAQTVPGVDIPASRIPAQCAVIHPAPPGCLGAVDIPAVEIPAVTIPGVTIPGVDVPGVRRPAVSTPAVSGGPRTEPARHADEVCQLKPRGGGLAPAVVRPAVVRPAVVRPAVVRQAVVRPAACHDLDCAEAIAVPAVVADAVVVDAFVVDAEVIDAKVFPEAPKAQVLQGAGTTTYVLRADLLFDFNKADIRPDAAVTLRQVAASIARRFPGARLEIDGHTDSVGGDAYNLDLSLRRARAVAGWLGRNGHLDAGRMTTRGYGESKPVAPNTRRDGSDNPTGRQLNRRVAIGVLRG
jgi:outer membrane protein OmpA-like peptidoglycan-associated protein